MNDQRPRKIFFLVVPAVSTLAVLVVFETLLALACPVPFSIEQNFYFVDDPFTGYRLKPGGEGYVQRGIPARANRHGHRDEDVAVEKPPRTVRVLALGDSFTVGAGVRQEEAYPEVLEELLNARLERPVQVVNAGVGGWSPFQYAQYYEHYGARFAPDLVLVGFYVGNDTYDKYRRVEELRTAVLGRRVERDQARSLAIRPRVWLYEHSHLARLLMNRGAVAEDVTRRHCADFSEQYLAIQSFWLISHRRRDSQSVGMARNSVRQIARIQRMAHRDSIPVVVALIPTEMQVNPGLVPELARRRSDRRLPSGQDPLGWLDLEMPQSLLEEMFESLSIPTIDLLPAFAADPRCLYMNDTHWTPEGHRLAAEVITSQVEPLLGRSRRP